MNIKSKALLAYLVIFLLGGASGFFLNEAIGPRFEGSRFERGPGPNNDFPFSRRGEIPPRMRNFIIEKLDLRDNQVDPFFDIQAEHLQNLFQVMKDHREEEIDLIRDHYADFINDAREILSEEQVNELNSFAHPDSVHQRRMQRRDRHGNSR